MIWKRKTKITEKKTATKKTYVKNAKKIIYNGIEFKSKLEYEIYKTIIDNDIHVVYEPEKYTIWSGIKPTIPFYILNKKTKHVELDKKKILDITYTPDLIFYYKNYIIIIEVKPGFCNEVYPYKRKMFRKYLETFYETKGVFPIFSQLGSKKQTEEFLNILKNEF